MSIHVYCVIKSSQGVSLREVETTKQDKNIRKMVAELTFIQTLSTISSGDMIDIGAK